MATAKKLPSHNYRVRKYDKWTKKYVSFTAPDPETAENMASDWAMKNKRRRCPVKKEKKHELTVAEAVRAQRRQAARTAFPR